MWSDQHSYSWSLGPFEYAHNSQISVEDFVNEVNEKFERAYFGPAAGPDNGGTYVLYNLDPEIATRGRFTESDVDFLLRYNITKINVTPLIPAGWGTLQEFQIKFRDGPHGYMQPALPVAGVVPRGKVSWENTSDTRATVLSYSSHTVSIMDSPPVPPNLRIIPYAGVSTRLLLLMNSNTGEYDARPVVIKDTDTEMIPNQYVSQTGNPISPDSIRDEIADPSSQLVIQYKNDDPITKYEVFRITNRPTSYDDFNTSNNPHKTITGQIAADKETTAGVLIDEVQPNTKYYYCVRAIDVHNNFSNPTHVFEAELVDNDGQVYLILKTILFENDMSGDNTKPGRRFLYIEPSIRNLSVPAVPPANSTANDLPNTTAPLFGATDSGDTCWNKTFKVRLTSKKSNKKIDLNILFKNTGVINP